MKKVSLAMKILMVSMLLAGLVVNNSYAVKPDKPGKPDEPYEGSKVIINGNSGNWQLLVDGNDFFIKGLCFGPDISRRTIAAYMTQVEALGANTIRTWGTGYDTKVLLDAAQKRGIKVCMGIWLQHFIDYDDDEGYKTHILAEIINWIKRYKDHPAVLMWSVGNEVMLHLDQHFKEPELKENRIAYAEFVEQVCVEIKKIDTHHPVTSTVAYPDMWSYFSGSDTPLDLYATNAYKDILSVQDKAEQYYNFSKPYMITEFGPDGEWEVDVDSNGVALESNDLTKAAAYYDGWNDHIIGNKGSALGGFAFIYGEKEDFGGVWFNLLMNGQKRPSFYSVEKMYHNNNNDVVNRSPVISGMSLDESSGLVPNSFVNLNVVAGDPQGNTLSYQIKLCGRDVTGNEGLYLANFEEVEGEGEGVFFNVTLPDNEGKYKVYIFVSDGEGNIGIEARSMVVGGTVSSATLPAVLTRETTSGSKLGQNFPNPFNPETWIPYSLSQGSNVKIKIYNVVGQLLRTLDLGYKTAGDYLSRNAAAYWDGNNSGGEEMASGVYFYRLETDSFTSTKRMVILK